MISTRRPAVRSDDSRKFQAKLLQSVAALLSLLALSGLAACSSDSSSSDTNLGSAGTSSGSGGASANGGSGGSSGSGVSGSGSATDRVGQFIVKLAVGSDGSDPYTSVTGKIYTAPVPPPNWTSAVQESGCSLYTPRSVFCDPACSGSDVCVESGGGTRCAPYPEAYDAGVLTVSGLRTAEGTTEFSMKPTVSGSGASKSVAYTSSTLPGDAVEEGVPVGIETAEAASNPFVLEAKGIRPIEMPRGELAVESGKPTKLTWTAGGELGARIQITLHISQHGGAKGKIECDVPDTGSLEISAALTKKLLDLGVAGFPSVQLARASTGTARIPSGLLELLVYSGAERLVTVPGLTSCNSNAECPSGSLCDLTKKACQ